MSTPSPVAPVAPATLALGYRRGYSQRPKDDDATIWAGEICVATCPSTKPPGSDYPEYNVQHAAYLCAAANAYPDLVKHLKACLGYIEMRLAHDGVMNVEQIMERLADVQAHVGIVETSHHLGCSKTTRSVDLMAIRAALALKPSA